MPVLTKQPSMGDVLKYEANPNYTREVVTLLQGMPYPVGSVLGQITASVAHETAQPVAAIRTYAANGELLLDRGAWDDVRANLRAIAGLTDRIGAVTAQLRGFAPTVAGLRRAHHRACARKELRQLLAVGLPIALSRRGLPMDAVQLVLQGLRVSRGASVVVVHVEA